MNMYLDRIRVKGKGWLKAWLFAAKLVEFLFVSLVITQPPHKIPPTINEMPKYLESSGPRFDPIASIVQLCMITWPVGTARVTPYRE